MILLAALALAAEPLQLADSTPVYCKNSRQQFEPIRDLTLGRFKRMYATKFRFGSTLMATGRNTATLEFRGGANNDETISYDVAPLESGAIALLAMHTRAVDLTEDLTGTDMCWLAFKLVYGSAE